MALGYQHVVFEKYRIYDRSLEVRVGRRLAPKSSGLGAGAVSWLLRATRVNWGIELSSRPVELTAVGS